MFKEVTYTKNAITGNIGLKLDGKRVLPAAFHEIDLAFAYNKSLPLVFLKSKKYQGNFYAFDLRTMKEVKSEDVYVTTKTATNRVFDGYEMVDDGFKQVLASAVVNMDGTHYYIDREDNDNVVDVAKNYKRFEHLGKSKSGVIVGVGIKNDNEHEILVNGKVKNNDFKVDLEELNSMNKNPYLYAVLTSEIKTVPPFEKTNNNNYLYTELANEKKVIALIEKANSSKQEALEEKDIVSSIEKYFSNLKEQCQTEEEVAGLKQEFSNCVMAINKNLKKERGKRLKELRVIKDIILNQKAELNELQTNPSPHYNYDPEREYKKTIKECEKSIEYIRGFYAASKLFEERAKNYLEKGASNKETKEFGI